MQSWPIFRRSSLPNPRLLKADFFLKCILYNIKSKSETTHRSLMILAIHVVPLLFFQIFLDQQYTNTFVSFNNCYGRINHSAELRNGSTIVGILYCTQDIILRNWPSQNTIKRIFLRYLFFLLSQMKQHFWKWNEIYIFQNYSYFAIHDFHSLIQKHPCHLVFRWWPKNFWLKIIATGYIASVTFSCHFAEIL